jgi:hypothetical protein
MNAGWQVQLLQDVSNHYRSHHTKTDSNYNANIEGRLNTKMSLASEQNAIHEIGLKYQHLRNDDDDNGVSSNSKSIDKFQAENLLNENQLLDEIESSSNNDFQPEQWLSHDNVIDSSPEQQQQQQQQQYPLKRSSSGQMQKQSQLADQESVKKNDLWDEIEEKLSKTEQQGLHQSLVPLHRVKRRDAINQSKRRDVSEIEMNEIGNNWAISENDDDELDDDLEGLMEEDNVGE